MYPGHGNPMGSMPNPAGAGGDAMRGQYHVHHQHQHQYHQQASQPQQYHQHHHHHHSLQEQTGHGHGHVSGHGQHVHGHSRHSHHAHERSSRDDRRGSSGHRHGNLPVSTSFAMATGGESPYGVLQPQYHGGFVMGTDLRTTTPTSGGWYHEQPELQQQIQSVMTSLESVPQPESTIPKDSESYVFGEVKDGQQLVGHKQPVKPLLQEGWRASSVRCTVPKLYQPFSGASPKPFVITTTTEVSKTLDHPRDKDGNNPVLHCIELQHHIEELKSIISTLPSRPQELVPSALLQPSVPPKPSRFHSEPPTQQPYDPIKASEEKLPEVQLDQTALHLLLRKSTAAICAHVGYKDASSRALDTLTDVLGHFLGNFCKIMRINADRLQEDGSLSFQDVLDQSLHQCGMRGKAELHQFWKNNVSDYMKQLNGEVESQMAEYEALTDPNSGKQKSSVPSSLRLPRAKDQQELRLPSIWPAATPLDTPGGFLDEELTLDTVNLENVLPTKTPDLSGPSIEFSQFSDAATQESEGFTPLTIDGPPRKRLRTMALEPQIT